MQALKKISTKKYIVWHCLHVNANASIQHTGQLVDIAKKTARQTVCTILRVLIRGAIKSH